MKNLMLTLCLLLSTGALAESQIAGKKYNFLADDLATSCVDGHAEKRGLCLGYIAGVTAMQKKACVPSNAKFNQVKFPVENYLEDNQEKLDQHAFKVVISALQQTWPCK